MNTHRNKPGCLSVRRPRNRRGSAILVAMGVIALSSIVGAILVNTTRQQVFSVQTTRDFLLAKVTAEAGVNDAYEQIKNDFRELTVSGTLNEGTYDATVYVGTNRNGRIVSVGRVGLAEATVSATLHDFGQSRPVDPAFLYAICCGGYLDISGNVTVNGAKLHSNNALRLSGSGAINASDLTTSSVAISLDSGAARITGNVRAPSIGPSSRLSKISGTQTVAAVPTVQIPDLDLARLFAIAQANGQVYSGSRLWNHSFAPQGGVVWVNGSIQLTGSGTFTGAFIATGDIDMGAGISIAKVSNFPAVASMAGDITLKGNTVTGLIYARAGNIDVQSSNFTINGSVICSGNVTGRGGWTLNYVDSSMTDTDSHVVITAWE